MKKRIRLFEQVTGKLQDGLSITFDRYKIVCGDNFLIFNELHPKITVTFRCPGDLQWVHFDGDEPMLLKNVPTEFIESILKNID